MRRLLGLTLLLMVLVSVGCQGVVGPLQRPCTPNPLDNPCLTIEEQQKFRRDRSSLPDASSAVMPRLYIEDPNVRGVK